jgi:hypothetical protein
MKTFGDLRGLAAEERERRFLNLARAEEADLAKALPPDKLSRLRQIDLQLRGPSAFQDPDVDADLKLTDEQKKRIRAIEADTFFGPPGGPGGLGPGPRLPGAPDPRQTWKDAARKAQEILTPPQQETWRHLTGEPFKGSPQPFRFGPPGPGH